MEKTVSVLIHRLNRKGKGVGTFSHGLKSASVFAAIPGDEVIVELGRKRQGTYQGRLKEMLTPSSSRVTPRCSHVGTCGGCSLQQMSYEAQLAHKDACVRRAFGPLLTPAVDLCHIIPCADPWRYRNKMEFSFSQNRAGDRFLGLMMPDSAGRVLNLTECHLVSEWFVHVLQKVRLFWEASGLSAYRMNDTGTLRTLTLREGKRTGDKMVILTVSGNPAYPFSRSHAASFVQTIREALPHDRISIFLRIQQAQKGHPTQFYEMHLDGPDHISEKLTIHTGRRQVLLSFKISPSSFFQPNSAQAEILYSQALQMISFPKKQVLDLYAGGATLGMALALEADAVTAIELNPYAVFDAEASKELNGIANLNIVCGDVGKKLGELQEKKVLADLVVVDPPRAGLDDLALSHLIALCPPEILYISCNPETQARDVERLVQGGYALCVVQPVDQFPHTVHVENIALLKRI